ncbi:MAG: HDOD domain-containing protein [Defluviitaleaceae bacterium]|nr:HDOD domain-containing protein [Defluviitaleaceae bacterium]MCL2264352.1 HDOD domain-containing protein [Defluviitaleaceae bacterium]
MNLLIVPKPLFTEKMVVEGYYMAAQYGNAILESTKSNPLDRAMDSPFIDFMNQVGLESLTQGKPIFIPITQIQLFTELTRNVTVEPEKIVFLLDEKIAFTDAVIERCKHFSEMGHKFAMYFSGKMDALEPMKPYISFVFAKVPSENIVSVSGTLRKEMPKVTIIATDVTEKPVFDQITQHRDSKIDLFDGPFYKVRVSSKAKQNALSPLKTNYIQLLNIVSQDDFDYQTFTKTIRQDTALAIQFMRLVNTASKSRSEIKNLNQAAAMLGQKEIKKWVSTAVSNALCVDSPSEIMRLSLIRAKFCENLARHFEMAVQQENLFLMGLFSVLDVVLDIPIEEAFKMVFVPPQIHNALVNKEGDYFSVLFFVQQYEMGHWKEISRVALVRNLTIEQIHYAYKEALIWYSDLINMTVDQSDL